eukprot:jgi/Mesvir1/28247/Mv04788-RA.1
MAPLGCATAMENVSTPMDRSSVISQANIGCTRAATATSHLRRHGGRPSAHRRGDVSRKLILHLGSVGLRGSGLLPSISRTSLSSPARPHDASKRELRVQCAGNTKVRFFVPIQVNFGESLRVVGSSSQLGEWQPDRAAGLNWGEAGWSGEVELPQGAKINFKFLIVRPGGHVEWESGSDRALELPSAASSVEVKSKWGDAGAMDVSVTNMMFESINEVGTAQAQERDRERQREAERQQREEGRTREKEASVRVELATVAALEAAVAGGSGEKGSVAVAAAPVPQVLSSSNVEMSSLANWAGKDVVFMRKNDHSSERVGQWNTEGLQGAALAIVQGDQRAGSWRKKLHVVQDLLAKPPGENAGLDEFVHCAAYLHWVSSGAIPCVEDGGHHRPKEHAITAREIFRSLERLVEKRGLLDEEWHAARRIQPKLPAFTDSFTTAVPLTRIRDIAHRSDIPHELKQEIKHTIQNKLHRNAGPEDLLATELMLTRILRDKANYSDDFVNEFLIFHKELKEFFNAAGLTDQLNEIKPCMDPPMMSMVDGFMETQERLEVQRAADGKDSMENLLNVLHTATGLRAYLLSRLSNGLRNDAPDTAIATRQKWRLAEISLEDYSFGILSRLVNAINQAGGADRLAKQLREKGDDTPWNTPLGAVVLAIRHIGLSRWQQAECLAIDHEITAWQEARLAKPSIDAIPALRLKASLERARRLASTFSASILSTYGEASMKLGNALGVASSAVTVFCESEIRASVVFQLAKLCSLLLKALREGLGEPDWDILVAGDSVGKLVAVDRISPENVPGGNEKVILLVREADGDEEVRAAGANVAGVVLLQELPHLSHLGVRARQEKVTFVTCEEEDAIKYLRTLVGKTVRLDASGAVASVKEWDGSSAPSSASPAAPSQGAAPAGDASPGQGLMVDTSRAGSVLQLPDVTKNLGGAKSHSCAVLGQLAERATPGAEFLTPTGLCLPYGSMEDALKEAGMFDDFSRLLEEAETARLDEGVLEDVAQRLQAIVAKARPSDEVINEISTRFPRESRLIVRSSANVEDLAGMSGAGLYESIPNVSAHEPEGFCEAVAKVWASLYTRRAILSRRVAGVKQSSAAMAVLVQELLRPSLSFVLHTVSPLERDPNKLYAEVAVGLGETLASGTRGTPWRMVVDKESGDVKMLSFANFSQAYRVKMAPKGAVKVQLDTVDYSKEALSLTKSYQKDVGKRLGAIGTYLEQAFGAPQDIEGAIVGEEIYIVQARPQP